MSNRAKGFLIVYTLFLAKTLSYQSSLVSDYHPILTLFVFENPLGAYGIAVLWRWYQNPNMVSLKVFKLLMHGINPIRIR